MEYVPGIGMVQAQGPPSLVGAVVDRTSFDTTHRAEPTTGSVGTAGGEATAPLGPLVTAKRPQGLNGVFVEFDDRRYFSDGPTVELNVDSFTRVGDYHGFPVYRRGAEQNTIYIPPLAASSSVLSRYSTR
jgi:hypothetical protein